MELRDFKDEEDLSRWAADYVVSRILLRPEMLLCVATGHSTDRLCMMLVDAIHDRRANIERLRLIQLDEWWGLAPDDAGRCDVQLHHRLVKPLGISPDRFISFDSDTHDAAAACRSMAARLAAEGPIDVCVLGMGRNGHLGFNEPGPYLSAGVHVAALTEQTRRHAMVDRMEASPHRGVTLGMANIMAARDVILVVMGAGKIRAVEDVRSHQIRTACPASLLHLHPKAQCGIYKANNE